MLCSNSMKIDFDFQIQSSASDGVYAPRELVARARRLGLKTIAITDHDTVSGVLEAMTAGREQGMEVISGIELSVSENGAGYHMLGYGIDIENTELSGALNHAQEQRTLRAKEMVMRLQKMGFSLTYEDVLRYAGGTSIGRPHITRAVLGNPENKKMLGDIKDMGEFIRAYLVSGKEAYVENEHISVMGAITLIHHAGGVAVWSHPALNASPEDLESTLLKFREYGLDGLEAFNPAHTEGEVRLLVALGEKHKFLITGGSDFHTDEAADGRRDGGMELASFPTFDFPVEQIPAELRAAIAAKQK